MIRVELVGRQRRSPWSKALLAAVVVCGGLYGLYQFFPTLVTPPLSPDAAPSPVGQPETVHSSAAQPETTPEPETHRETAHSSAAHQETTTSPVQETEPEQVAQPETAHSSATHQETTPEPEIERETAHSSAAHQETATSPVQGTEPEPVTQPEVTPSSAAQQDEPEHVAHQETVSSTAAQPETTPSTAAQPEVTPSSAAQSETATSPVQQTVPKPTAQPETTPSPVRETVPNPVVRSTPSQRSTACHQVMRIDEQVPAGIRVASLNCNSSGEYWLEGTSPSHSTLRAFRLRLQALPSQISFSTWREERTLRFRFQGRFTEQGTPPQDALSASQAAQFLGKVAHWADASGLDSLSIHDPISLADTRQRQKLRGIGSPQQISAFLHQFQQAEAVATLGEVLLMPIQIDERGWVKARLYAAVDIAVAAP